MEGIRNSTSKFKGYINYKVRRDIYIVALFFVFFKSYPLLAQPEQKLWFNQSARCFEESLLLGNGKMGASILGDAVSEKIYLNDATLWTGEPENPNLNPEAYRSIPLVREALNAHKYKLADSLNKKTRGIFSESFAPLGTLLINFNHNKNISNYRRELDINTALSKISYKVNGVEFVREYFVSQPDQIMAIRLRSSKKAAINCNLTFESLLRYQISGRPDILEANGYAPYHAEPSYMGEKPDAILFDKNRGTRFTALFKVINKDGNIFYRNNQLCLSNCSEAIVYISLATSFNGYNKNPATEGKSNHLIAARQLQAVCSKTFEDIQKRHVADYQSFFNRVKFSLGKAPTLDLPTNERLKRYSEGKEDKGLEILYFQFGRYLLISSSRTIAVPANLQGIWNPYMRPPWSSNYTLNINAEENYWLAEIANLTEMHAPLLSFMDGLSKTGAITSKNFYGTGGWAACHNSDIWAMSNQVGDFGNPAPNTVIWNMGGVWLSTHLWEHYSFTRDVKFLRTKAYPLMKGAAQFCLDWMVKDKYGKWITSPGTSPENLFLTPDGYAGATSYGNTSDLAMIRELFEDVICASRVLNIHDTFTQKVISTHKDLHPYQIGRKGNLQEWYYDWDDADPQHRHQSHLFGLYPGHQIYPKTTPELADACRRTLEIKGDETTGWSKGWRINLWARLWDGNHAYKMYRELLRYVEPAGLTASYHGGGGTYPSLLDAHPPFQIDGNLGGAASVIEMLVQSTESSIYLLPALPDAWREGTIEGICTRSGCEVSVYWKNSLLEKVKVKAKADGKVAIVYGNKQRQINLKKGEIREITKWW